MMRGFWLFGALLAGCTGEVVYDGNDMLDYFTFEDNVDCEWEFAHDDTLRDHGMIATITNWEYREGSEWFEVSYVKDCRGDGTGCVDGEMIRQIDWTTSNAFGVGIEAVDGPSGSFTFDPQIEVTDRYTKIGESFTTETGGATYTSTLLEFGDCKVPLSSFTGCAVIEIASSDGVQDIVGTYRVVSSFGVVNIDWPDQGGEWKLVQHNTLE